MLSLNNSTLRFIKTEHEVKIWFIYLPNEWTGTIWLQFKKNKPWVFLLCVQLIVHANINSPSCFGFTCFWQLIVFLVNAGAFYFTRRRNNKSFLVNPHVGYFALLLIKWKKRLVVLFISVCLWYAVPIEKFSNVWRRLN